MHRMFKVDHAGMINRLWFIAGLAVLFLLIVGLTKEIVNRRQIDRQINDYKNQIDELKAENSALSGKIDNWSQSGELELSAREKLGLEKPGEQTIIITRASDKYAPVMAIRSNQKPIDLTVDDSDDDSQSNPAKWWNYFFSN